MAESFVLTAQLQTQLHTASVRRTIADLRRQLAGINVRVKVTGAETIKKEMDTIKKKTKDATGVLEDFGKQGALAAKRFAAFSIATAGFIAFVSAIRNGIKEAIDFERQMIRVSQVTGLSMNTLKGLQKEITNLSTGLGVSSEKLVDISRILAQTGMTAKDTRIALEALAKTELAPTFTNIEKTTEAAIAAMRQFNIEASKLSTVLGQMNALAGNFAVEADDLGVVIRRAGGAFKSAGGDLLELEALFTSVRSTTRESAETIATGFRTIFTRMRRPKTIGFLKELGVNLEDMTGKFVGPYEAVRRLNTALSELDPRDTRYAQIIEELGGFRQVSKVIPLIQQFEKAELARATAMRGSTSLTRDALSAQDALAIRLMKLKEQFAELMRSFMDNKGIQVFIELSLRLAEALLKITSALEPLVPLIAVLGASALFKGAGRLAAGAKGGLGFNKGGWVPGVGNTDTVPAMLTPGEFVIRKDAAAKLGSDQLNSMNRYASGGVVRKGRHGYGQNSGDTADIEAEFHIPAGTFGGFFMKPHGTKDAPGSNFSTNPVGHKTLRDDVAAHIAEQTGKKPDEIKQLSKAGKLETSVRSKLWTEMIDPEIQAKIENKMTPKIKKNLTKAAKKIARDFNIKGIKFDASKSTDAVDFDSIEGHLFEGIIAGASGAALSQSEAGWDFKNVNEHRQSLAQLFGEIPNSLMHADAKRRRFKESKISIKDKIKKIFGGHPQKGVSNVTFTELLQSGNMKLVMSGGLGESEEGTDDPEKGVTTATARRRTPQSRTGQALTFNKGGVVDSVPALLTPGEFVINKSSAEAIGYGKLNQVNKYAAGGIVRKGRSRYGGSAGGFPLSSSTSSTTQPTTQQQGMGVAGTAMAMTMVAGFVSTLVDADSALGKVVNIALTFATTLATVTMLMESEMVTNMHKRMGIEGEASDKLKAFGAIAMASGMALNAFGNLIKEWGTDEIKRTGGKSGGGLVEAGGAVGGAGIGMGVGAMLLGPWGAAIGAAVGAVWGFVNAAQEAADAIGIAKLETGTKGFSESMKNVEMGFSTLAEATPHMASSLNALDRAMGGSAKVREQAEQQAKGSFQNYNKIIDGIAKESSSMGEFFSQIPQSSLRQFAKINNLPYGKLEQKIRNQIKANEEAALSAKKFAAAMEQSEKVARAMAGIDRAVLDATLSMQKFGGIISAISGKAKPLDLTKGTVARPSNLSNRERKAGGVLDREVDVIASILPKSRGKDNLIEQSKAQAKVLAVLRDSIQSASTTVKKGGLGQDKKVSDILEDQIRKKIGRPAADTPEDRAVKDIMRGIGGIKEEDLRKQISTPGQEGKIVKAAEKDTKRQFETLKRLAKFINDATKQYQAAYAQRTKLELELVKESKKLVKLQRERFEVMKKARGGEGMTPAESEAFFKRQNLAAAPTSAAVTAGNVGGIAKEYRDLGKSLRDNRKSLSSMGTGTEDEIERRRKLAETIAHQETQFKSLGAVIQNYQNVQQRTAALQDKLNKLNQDASKRRGMVDQYMGATDETRAEMDRVAGMASRIADGTMAFGGVPEELRSQTLSFMDDMAGMSGPLGEKFKKARGEARIQQFERMGIKLTSEDRKQLREEPTSEMDRLADKIDQAYKDAIKLQNEGIIQGVKDGQTDLELAITQLKTAIQTDLKGVMLDEEGKRIQEENSQLTTQINHLAAIERLLTDLNREFGIEGTASDIGVMKSVPEAQKRADEANRSAAMIGTSGEVTRGGLSRGRWSRAGGKNLGFIDRQRMTPSSTLDEKGVRQSVFPTMDRKAADKYLDLTAEEITKGMLKKQKVDLTGVDMSKGIQSILTQLKDQGKITEEGFLKGERGLTTSLKPEDIQRVVQELESLRGELDVAAEGTLLSGAMDPKNPGLRMPAGTGSIFSDKDYSHTQIDQRVRAVLDKLAQDERDSADKMTEIVETKLTLLLNNFEDKHGRKPEAADREALREKLIGDTKEAALGGKSAKDVLRGMTKEDTMREVQRRHTEAMKARTDNTTELNNVNGELRKINDKRALAGQPAIAQSDVQIDPKNLSDPKLANKYYQNADTIGSNYVHDTHVEKVLIQISANMQRLADGLLGAVGGKPTSENAAPAVVARAVENKKVMSTMPNFDAFAKSASGLTTTMGKFISAFEGGISWSLDAHHTIDINHNGAELVEIMNPLIAKKMVNTAMAAIEKYMSDNHPNLPRPTPNQAMGGE